MIIWIFFYMPILYLGNSIIKYFFSLMREDTSKKQFLFYDLHSPWTEVCNSLNWTETIAHDC